MERKRKQGIIKSLKKKMRKIEKKLHEISSSDTSDSEDSSSSSHSGSNSNEEEQREDIQTILGSDPNSITTEGPEINQDIANRWISYLTNGLEKETRRELLSRWNVPKNCNQLKAPKLNPEFQTFLSSLELKREVFLQNTQEMLGKGLTALGASMSLILADVKNQDEKLVSALVDAGKLLSDTHHTISTHRRHQLKYRLTPKIQKIVQNQGIDEFLFGSNLSDSCKAAKCLETTAKEWINKPGPSKARQHLNWKTPSFRNTRKIERRGGRQKKDWAQREREMKYKRPYHK